MENLWWGYEHVNGTLQVKRYFDKGDLDEACESPFVVLVKGPFPAQDRQDAIVKLQIAMGR